MRILRHLGPASALFLSMHLGAVEGPTAPPAPGGDGAIGGRRLERLLNEHPELKGVDQSTPEGQEKFRQAMQQDFAKNAGQMRQRMAENQAAEHGKLRDAFGMTAEEFGAVEPLLARIELLRLQQRAVAPQPAMGPGRGRGPGGGDFLTLLLGDTPLDPAAKETRDAARALTSLLQDPQANATEVAAAVARTRQARTALTAVVDKAQAGLRAVLTPRQEALLIERGILE